MPPASANASNSHSSAGENIALRLHGVVVGVVEASELEESSVKLRFRGMAVLAEADCASGVGSAGIVVGIAVVVMAVQGM